ncbi:MAG: AMP-binding protein [Dehalococcoidia bacterium]|nr:AMP-binding protein [Dehalococcoidia bacterium]
MPKTIAITPSWYWPAGIPRVVGIPPYSIYELCVLRPAREWPAHPAIYNAGDTITFEELRDEVEGRAETLRSGSSNALPLEGTLTRDSLLQLLAGLAAQRLVSVGTDDVPALDPVPSLASPRSMGEQTRHIYEPAVVIPGTSGPVAHSNRSLFAAALSLATFFDVVPGRAWLPLLPLDRWETLAAVVAALYLGSPIVMPSAKPDPEASAAQIKRYGVGYALGELETAASMTREAKKAVKDARGVLLAWLLATHGSFEPDQRSRVARAFESPALTFWGLPETGPVFASHQSWYLDESVGIPVTNAHVVPADPRNGQPIAALWELVESAEVTVWSPSLFVAGQFDSGRFAGQRYRTGMSGSSDANGMIYLLG